MEAKDLKSTLDQGMTWCRQGQQAITWVIAD